MGLYAIIIVAVVEDHAAGRRVGAGIVWFMSFRFELVAGSWHPIDIINYLHLAWIWIVDLIWVYIW